MAATVRASIGTSTGPTLASAEGGIKWNQADSATDTTTPIQIPVATGSDYSWVKNLALEVTATAATTISNRKIRRTGAPPTGMELFFKDGGATYAQATSGNKPAASGSAGPATPAGYTAMTTTGQVWHSTGVSAGSTGVNGNWVIVVMGVDNSYAGGGGTNQTAPTLELIYDEA